VISCKFKRIVSILCLIIVAACAKHQIPPQALGYNEGLANFTNQQIVLNIIRAAKRMPYYFNGIGDITLSDAIEPQFRASIPFVDRSSTNNFTPSLNLNNGFNAFNATNLNDEKFANSILEPIKPSVFQYFINLGIPEDRLFNLLVGSISIAKENYNQIKSEADKICSVNKNERFCNNRNLAHELDRLNVDKRTQSFCSLDNGKKYLKDHEGDRIIKFKNSGRSACERIKYQILIRNLNVLDFEISRIGNEFKLAFFDINKNQINSKFLEGNSREKISIRSPEGVIFYLGEIVGIKLFQKDKFFPTIGFENDELFEIEYGPARNPTEVAVNVDGQFFRIAADSRPDNNQNTSLAVLNLVKLLIQLQTTETSLDDSSQTLRLITDEE